MPEWLWGTMQLISFKLSCINTEARQTIGVMRKESYVRGINKLVMHNLVPVGNVGGLAWP